MWVPLLLLFWTVNTRAIGNFLQVQQNKFVLAEVALRFWCRFDNFWMWSVFPIYPSKSNFWALEQALIQLWQPRLNTPFIYQFFNCRKGLIPRTKFSSSRQFGFYSLWRKLRWKSTPPTQVRRALHSPIFGRRVSSPPLLGKLSKTSVAIRSRDFTWKNDSAPTRSAQMDVTSFDASPTTWENLNVRTLSTPSTGP